MSSGDYGWLIEKPEPGGTYWWAGREDEEKLMGRLQRDSEPPVNWDWPVVFTQNPNRAIRFRSRADAEAAMQLFPKTWGDIFVATDHMWLAPGVAEAEDR